MVKQCMEYARGHVRILVWGSSYERFLNMCVKHNIILWDLQAVHDAYEMNISIRGFRRLRPLVKKSGTKVRITKRYGLPFFLDRYKKRKMLFGGFLMGLLLILFLSGFIWDIHIEGNQIRTEEVVFAFLEEAEITHGMWKAGIDCKALAASLRKEFDDFIWVSVRIQGTRLLIDVQENTDLTLEDEATYGPSDLVSNLNGVVTKIVTRSGIPQVKAGDTVKKGDLLVTGQIEIKDDAGEVTHYQYCAADADIYIQTEYEYRDTLPMKYQVKEYTGQIKQGFYVELFGKKFHFLKRKNAFEQYDVVTTIRQLRLTENFYLPILWGKTEHRAYEIQEKTATKEEALRKANDNLNKNLEKSREKGVQIFKNDVKIETDGKNCKARGKITIIEKAGRRVERILGE